MRSDNLERHKKQHLKRNEDNPVTNENKIKDEEFRKALINLENEYQKKIVQGQKIYKMLGEGVVSYQALTRDMKEEVDLYIEIKQILEMLGMLNWSPGRKAY